MPAIETTDRYQYCVLWIAAGYDGFGQPLVQAPIEILVRWNNTARTMPDPKGGIISIDAQAVVDRDVPVDSLMWLGTLSSLPTPPTAPVDVMQVKQIQKQLDIKGRNTRFQVLLSRWKSQIPTQVNPYR